MVETSNNNLGALLSLLSPSQKKSVRSLEKARKKLVNAHYSRVFNEVCLRDNLYPKYSNIYIYIYIYIYMF